MLGTPACRPLGTGPAGGGSAGGGVSSTPSALVGAWRRTLVRTTSTDVTTSETTWLFGPDGACERVIATTTVSAGFTDTVRTPCSWMVSGRTLTITFGSGGTAQFTWSVEGSTLYLDGAAFQRT